MMNSTDITVTVRYFNMSTYEKETLSTWTNLPTNMIPNAGDWLEIGERTWWVKGVKKTIDETGYHIDVEVCKHMGGDIEHFSQFTEE